MRIIINEIKKLFSIKSLIILGLIVFIICNLFVSFWIEYFPNGSETPDFNLTVEMLKDYGTTMDEKEFENFKEKSALREREADEYLKQDEDAKELGITSYREFRDSLGKGNYGGKIDELHSKVYFNENIYLFWELQSRESLIASYGRTLDKEYGPNGISPDRQERLEELEKSDQPQSVLSRVTFDNYNNLITNFSIIIVVTVAFIISPIFLRDEKNKVNLLQYSSKTGRKIGKKKVISAMITSFGIATLELIFLFAMYIPNNTLQFWNCSINSRFNYITLWFDLTFGQYIMLSVFLIYVVTFVVTSISLFVSSKVKNYVALIGVQVPILGMLIAFLKNIGLNNMTVLGFPKYTLHTVYGALIVISIVLIVMLLKKEKNRDVLN
ncbi:hypothetical protein [Clostridium sp. LIBA-8841]|uniref:hypothetical protein n=1 Tax=Clostridium sp. LIBA-8841 TaxID=2987530 RepID=UPI002AC789EF|nr:hypothetical protein [Clostridium sp. LIBA-8841]MDZ5253596.1 hypothetical protein [Clostridium sp. LIBA-8841]